MGILVKVCLKISINILQYIPIFTMLVLLRLSIIHSMTMALTTLAEVSVLQEMATQEALLGKSGAVATVVLVYSTGPRPMVTH